MYKASGDQKSGLEIKADELRTALAQAKGDKRAMESAVLAFDKYFKVNWLPLHVMGAEPTILDGNTGGSSVATERYLALLHDAQKLQGEAYMARRLVQEKITEMGAYNNACEFADEAVKDARRLVNRHFLGPNDKGNPSSEWLKVPTNRDRATALVSEAQSRATQLETAAKRAKDEKWGPEIQKAYADAAKKAKADVKTAQKYEVDARKKYPTADEMLAGMREVPVREPSPSKSPKSASSSPEAGTSSYARVMGSDDTAARRERINMIKQQTEHRKELRAERRDRREANEERRAELQERLAAERDAERAARRPEASRGASSTEGKATEESWWSSVTKTASSWLGGEEEKPETSWEKAKRQVEIDKHAAGKGIGDAARGFDRFLDDVVGNKPKGPK